MGGINCGGGNWTSSPKPVVMGRYIEKLAQYSEKLFASSAKFFEANVSIEQSVQDGDHTFVDAIELLDSSIKSFEHTKQSLGGVSALHEQLGEPGYIVDFAKQLENISEAIYGISAARKMLVRASLNPEKDPQHALWSTTNLTQIFVSAMSSVQQTSAWQMDFAIRSNGTLLKVA